MTGKHPPSHVVSTQPRAAPDTWACGLHRLPTASRRSAAPPRGNHKTWPGPRVPSGCYSILFHRYSWNMCYVQCPVRGCALRLVSREERSWGFWMRDPRSVSLSKRLLQQQGGVREPALLGAKTQRSRTCLGNSADKFLSWKRTVPNSSTQKIML